jgi:hypothetical protein
MSKENVSKKEKDNGFLADVSERLYGMKLLEFASIPDGLGKTLVKRVPGGWIFYNYSETQATFVPFNNEFQNASRIKNP